MRRRRKEKEARRSRMETKTRELSTRRNVLFVSNTRFQ